MTYWRQAAANTSKLTAEKSIHPLAIKIAILNIAIEILSFTIENGDFPQLFVNVYQRVPLQGSAQVFDQTIPRPSAFFSSA